MKDISDLLKFKPLNVPVLFLVFNRFETTKRVFEAIKDVKPSKLYIASDGARKHVKGEDQIVSKVRDYILDQIDWPCKISTLFREDNQGCKMAVSSAISWFFEKEEMGIILEDDCLPDPSFFSFAELLLEKYKNDERVMMISGDNFQDGKVRGDGTYYFSKYSHIWGWATWRRAWQLYDVEMANYSKFEKTMAIKNIFCSKKEYKYWTAIFRKMYQKGIDTWDYQWVYTVMSNSGLSIIPNTNLISNIGFGTGATHTIGESELANMETISVKIENLQHPTFILPDYEADHYTFRKLFEKSFMTKILKKIKKFKK
jgi:hypothetical protein